MRNADCTLRLGNAGINRLPNLKRLLFIYLLLLLPEASSIAYAEIKVIEADSTYIMGDNDSKVDARRIATQEAKRKALELAGTYVQSLTEIKDYQLTGDEVKAYTAGVTETEIIADEMRGSTERPEVYIKTRCRIDTAVLTAELEQYKENEDVKEQLQASAKENEELKKERNLLIKQLAEQKDKAKTEETRERLETVLSKEETNEDTNKVWISVGRHLGSADESPSQVKHADLDKATAVLQRVLSVNPQNQRARYLLAAIYKNKGNLAAAESELQAAVQRNPSNPMPHLRLGLLLREQGKYEAALHEFHFVERLRPHHLLVLFYTGATFKDMNRCGRAVQYLQRFLKDPGSNRFPEKRDQAGQAIKECGGARGGYQQHVRYNR